MSISGSATTLLSIATIGLTSILAFERCSLLGIERLPSLHVTNETNDHYPIKSVELVGYNFQGISIDVGDSQEFVLDSGMPGGYEEILVTVRYGPPGSLWYASTTVDFSKGKTSQVTLTGCISFEGCEGFTLN
jgi:hypothetical protein